MVCQCGSWPCHVYYDLGVNHKGVENRMLEDATGCWLKKNELPVDGFTCIILLIYDFNKHTFYNRHVEV